MAKELSDFFKLIAQEKHQKIEEIQKDKKILKEFENFLYSPKPKKNLTAKKINPPETPDDFGNLSNISPPPLKEETLIERSLGLLSEPSNIKQKNDPITPLNQNFATHEDLQKHYKLFLERVQQQLSTLGGGGEYRFRYLDGIVGIQTNSDAYNNKYLKWNSTTNQAEFKNISTDYIEVYDRSPSIPLSSTPQLLKPSNIGNFVGIDYSASTGVFTFPNEGNYSLSLVVNAKSSASSNQYLYIYAENYNSGIGTWVANPNSGKKYVFNQSNDSIQIIYSQSVYRVAGQKVRYWIYSNDSKVELITDVLPGIDSTVYVPAIRIQYS